MSGSRLVHLLSSNHWGGVERYVFDICRHFSSLGWKVTVYTPDARIIDDNFNSENIDLRHAPLRGPFDWVSVRRLAEDFSREERGTVVHAHRYRDAYTALVARRLANRSDIRVMVTRHRCRPARNNIFNRHLYASIDAHVFPSQLACDTFVSAWSGRRMPIPSERLHVVRNSILMRDAELCNEPATGPRTGMYHGPLVPGKGVETIIDALSILKGSKIRMIILGGGDPDYVDNLRRRAITRGVMEMIDWKKGVAVPYGLIRQCHFGVQPSVMKEAFGLSNIEYMALRRPVICSNNGAQPEYVTNGKEGLLVTPANAAALAAAIEKMAFDDEFRHAAAEAALNRYKDTLSWDRFADSLADIYIG